MKAKISPFLGGMVTIKLMAGWATKLGKINTTKYIPIAPPVNCEIL